jgi:mannose-6-phosphate isomerase-like protein (cupin superfamily)
MPVVNKYKYKTRIEGVNPDGSRRQEDGWVGFNIRWLINRDSMGAELGCLGFAHFPIGSKHNTHLHTLAEEFCIYTSGRGLRTCGGQEYNINPGDIVFTPLGAIHGLKNYSQDSPLELWCFYAGGGTVDETGYQHITDETRNKAVNESMVFKSRMDSLGNILDESQGVKTTWLISNRRHGSSLGALAHVGIPPKKEFSRAVNKDCEGYTIFLKGNGICKCGDEEFEVGSGDVVFTPRAVAQIIKSEEAIDCFCIFAGNKPVLYI